MANQDHLDILTQGVDPWNHWREANPLIKPDLSNADLKGYDLSQAHLDRTNLSRVSFDRTTILVSTIFGMGKDKFALLIDVDWEDADLSQVEWELLSKTGEEYEADQFKDENDKQKDHTIRIQEYKKAVRATRQLVFALYKQGLNEVADRFSYRVQVLQRKILEHQILEKGFQDRSFFIQTLFFYFALSLIVWGVFELYSLVHGVTLSSTAMSIALDIVYPILLLLLLLGIKLLIYGIIYSSNNFLFYDGESFSLDLSRMMFIIIGVFFFIGITMTILVNLPIAFLKIISVLDWIETNGMLSGIIIVGVLLLTILSLVILLFVFSKLLRWLNIGDYFQSLIKSFRNLPDYGRYAFSLLLDTMAGYGYKPERSFILYLLVIFGFDIFYYSTGLSLKISSLDPVASLVLSVSSFHGRGFFPGLAVTTAKGGIPLSLDNPINVAAAIEAVIGLFIEISFIATFTKRFFGR